MGQVLANTMTTEVWVELLGKLLERRAGSAHPLLPTWNADEKAEVKQASWAMRWPRGKGENVVEPWVPTSSR